MKSLRRAVAVVLAFTMIISTMSISMAKTTTVYDKEALVLNRLGLLNGVSDTTFDPYLEGSLIKGDALLLMASIFNWDLASASNVVLPFTDVKSWQREAVKYAYKNDIVKGESLTKMGQDINVKGIAVLYLRQLGYDADEAYKKAAELALKEKIVTVGELSQFNNPALRDNLVGVTHKTLTTKPVGKDKTVIEILVEKKVVDEFVAKGLGLYKPVPDEFVIMDVKPIGLAQTRIEFSHDIDPQETGKVTVNGRKTTLRIDENDANVLIATHTEARIKNQQKVKVKFYDIKDKDGEKIDNLTKEVYYEDKEVPVLESIEFVGKKHIKIIASEAIKAPTNAKNYIDIRSTGNKKAWIGKVEPQESNPREILVSLTSSIKEGEYTIRIKGGLEDYADWNLVGQENAYFEQDNSLPVLENVVDEVTTNNYVKLKFSKELAIKPYNPKPDKFRHTNSSNRASKVTISGCYIELHFDDNNALPDSTANIMIEADAFTDLYGIDNSFIYEVINIAKDNTAPTAKVTQYNNSKRQIVIEFNEDVIQKTAKDKDNYEVTLEGEIIKVTSIYKMSERKYRLSLSKEVTGDVVVDINGVEDKRGNKMNADFELQINDKDAPKASDVIIYKNIYDDRLMLRVIYPERMLADGSRYAINNKENYEINNKLFSNYDIELDVTENATMAIININVDELREIFNKKSGFKPSHLSTTDINSFAISRVADAQGNLMDQYYISKDPVGNTGIKVTASAIAVGKIELEFSEPVYNIDQEDFKLNGKDDDKWLEDSIVSDDNRKLTLEINKSELPADFAGTSTYSTIFSIKSNPNSGNEEFDNKLVSGSYKVFDKIKPSIAKLVNDDDDDDMLSISADNAIEVEFDKDVKIRNTASLAAIMEIVDPSKGNSLIGLNDFTVEEHSTDKKKIIIKIKETADKLETGEFDIKFRYSTNDSIDFLEARYDSSIKADKFEFQAKRDYGAKLDLAYNDSTKKLNYELEEESISSVKYSYEIINASNTTVLSASNINKTGDVSTSSLAPGKYTFKVDVKSSSTHRLYVFDTFTVVNSGVPSITKLSPVDNATNVALDSKLKLTFSENVQKGTGSITIYKGGSVVETIPVSNVTISGKEVTITPAASFEENTEYKVLFPSGTFKDMTNNPCNDLTGDNWSFTTVNNAPTFTLSPADNATNVALDSKLKLTFSENVQKGTGNITIYKGVSVVETIPVSNVTISGKEVTISPAASFEENTEYKVLFPSGIFKDMTNNPCNDLTGDNWSFTTVNNAPTFTLSPADNATNVALDSKLKLTFSENVQKGTGDITIYKGVSVVETIPVSNVTISGKEVTITPTKSFEENTEYKVIFSAGTFKDMTDNPCNDLTGDNWTFTAAEVNDPTATLSPVSTVPSIDINSNLTMTFDEPIKKGTGEIKVFKRQGDTLVETIDVTNAKVSINPANNTVTIDIDDLESGTDYYVKMPNTVFKDMADKVYAGVLDNNTWAFTTKGPKVISYTPNKTTETNEAVENKFEVKFNTEVKLSNVGTIKIFSTEDKVNPVDVINFAVLAEKARVIVKADGTGKNTIVEITIPLTSPNTILKNDKDYFINIDKGAITSNNATSDVYTGINDETTWTFTTKTVSP